jgi:hypothetical protein
MTTIQAGAEPRTALPGGRGVRRSELTIISVISEIGCCEMGVCTGPTTFSPCRSGRSMRGSNGSGRDTSTARRHDRIRCLTINSTGFSPEKPSAVRPGGGTNVGAPERRRLPDSHRGSGRSLPRPTLGFPAHRLIRTLWKSLRTGRGPVSLADRPVRSSHRATAEASHWLCTSIAAGWTPAAPGPTAGQRYQAGWLSLVSLACIQFLHVLGVEVHIGRTSTPELRASC